jgi:hypothetical protein
MFKSLTTIDEVVELGNASRRCSDSFGKDQRASVFGPAERHLQCASAAAAHSANVHFTARYHSF